MKGKILISFFIAIFLMSIIPYDNIKALAYQESIGFESGVKNLPYNDGFLKTTKNTSFGGVSRFCVNDSYVRSGSLNFMVKPLATTSSGKVTGWFNLTYSKSDYLTGLNFWIGNISFLSASGDGLHFIFYNETTQGEKMRNSPSTTYTSQSMMDFKYAYSVTTYYIQFGGVQYKVNATKNEQMSISVISQSGFQNLRYTAYDGDKYTKLNFVPSNSSSYVDNCRIDRMIVVGTNGGLQCLLDDLTFNISDSYVIGGTGGGGCIDVSDMDYYSKNIEVMDEYIDISSPFIEFTSHSSLSLTPEVFELWVGSALYDGDDDVSNYFLYINGLSCGNPECFYLLSGETYVLQWDLSSISPIVEEVLTFELAHSITFDGTNYWNIAKSTANLIYGAPSPTMITYKNTGTNGVLDGTPIYYGSCWKLYFSAFGTPENEENTEFDVGINLIGFNTHPTYNTPYSFIYETIYFEVFSNRTDNYYHLNISKGAITQGNEQGYPKDIYSYHIIHGFTPITNGNYTVSLCKDSDNTIVDHKHFNITIKTVDYAVWTFPNPSFGGVNHGVTVYISDDTVFQNYYVSGVVDEDNVNIFNLSNRKIIVGTLDVNKYWSTSLLTFAVSGWEYWRLWGTNDNISFIPLTSPYVHYVNSIAQYNYIRTSLTDGEGYTGESFNVYGQHSYILSQLSVYLDNKPIKDVSKNVSFLIPYSFSNVGTHTFSLRVFNDGEWEIVDSVIVSITIKPSGEGELGAFLPAPYSYIMGAIITIALMILPTIALGKIGVAQGETLKYVPIFSGTVGFILSCLVGFFPWYSIFALLFVLIMIITILYLSKKKE